MFCSFSGFWSSLSTTTPPALKVSMTARFWGCAHPLSAATTTTPETSIRAHFRVLPAPTTSEHWNWVWTCLISGFWLFFGGRVTPTVPTVLKRAVMLILGFCLPSRCSCHRLEPIYHWFCQIEHAGAQFYKTEPCPLFLLFYQVVYCKCISINSYNKNIFYTCTVQ